MPENIIPRLCAGTFVSLVLEARPDSGFRKTFGGTANYTSEPSYIEGLIKVAYPDFSVTNYDSFKVVASNLRHCCKVAGKYWPLEKKNIKDAFDNCIKNNYKTALSRMYSFLEERNVRVDSQIEWMTCGIIELVEKDNTIPDDAVFYVKESGRPISKTELINLKSVNLQAFLLGIWHYIVVNIPDNTVGNVTFENWYKAPDTPNSPWNYVGDIGKTLVGKIHITNIMSSPMRVGKDITETTINYSDNDAVPTDYKLFDKADYSSYIANCIEKYGKVKSLLYNTPKDFYSFYVPNDLAGESNRAGEDKYTLHGCRDNITAGKIFYHFGNFVFITGTGGLGKSMMMRHLLLSAAERYNEDGILPVYVALKDYDGKSEIFDFVYSKVNSFGDVKKEQFQETLVNGDVLLLLDGYDEIKSAYVDVFERKLEHFTDRFSHNGFIISSRPYQEFVSFSRFLVIYLQPFSKEQAIELIDRLEFRPDEPAIKEKFRNEVDTKLFASNQEFVENPLLLTIMLLTFEQFAEIPGKMHLFYREAFEALAQRHDATKGAYKREFKTGLSTHRLADYVAEFCCRTYKDEKYEFSVFEICQYFDSLKERNRIPGENCTADDFIYDLQNNLCLLYLEGVEYHFTHRSFQEYFCAVFFAKQKDKTLKSIGDFFNDSQRNMRSGLAFNMLYDMIPEKIEEYVLLPFLEELFSFCDDQGEPYLYYLHSNYYRLDFDVGDVGDYDQILVPSSFLYGFVIELNGFDSYKRLDISDVYSIDEFMTEQYVAIDISEEEFEIVNINDGMVDISRLEDSDISGSNYSVDIFSLIENPSKYDNFIKVISDKHFVLKREYEAVRQYYKGLKAKVKTGEGDFFDQFD